MIASEQMELPLGDGEEPPRAAPSVIDGIAIDETRARSILTPSRVPTMDFAINPYFGCGFGCSYCYAVFMCRSSGRPVEDWGRFVRAKVNLREVLGRELRRGKAAGARIFMSSVTDPYQPAEGKLGLTRAALELLVTDSRARGVTIMTKSPLVLRDMDLLKRLKADVGLSLAPLDDELGPYLEPRGSSTKARLETLRRLNDSGLETYAFVGPVFPHLEKRPERIERLLQGVRDAGTREVYVAWLNVRPDARRRMLAKLRGAPSGLVKKYYVHPDRGPKRRMEPAIRRSLEKIGLRMRSERIIDH